MQNNYSDNLYLMKQQEAKEFLQENPNVNITLELEKLKNDVKSLYADFCSITKRYIDPIKQKKEELNETSSGEYYSPLAQNVYESFNRDHEYLNKEIKNLYKEISGTLSVCATFPAYKINSDGRNVVYDVFLGYKTQYNVLKVKYKSLLSEIERIQNIVRSGDVEDSSFYK